MVDIDIDLFGEHDKTEEHPVETGENIPRTPFTPGGVTWEPVPEREQETPFVGSVREEVLKECIKGLYRKLSESMDQTPRISLRLFRNHRWKTVPQGHEHAFTVIHFSTQMSSQSSSWKMTPQIKLDIT